MQTRRFGSLVTAILMSLPLGCGQRSAWTLQPDGRMNASAISESSGVVVSRRFDDVLWTHNDSNNGNFLFAIDRKGQLIRSYEIDGAFNNDWEDIALDSRGNLYLLDNTSRADPQKRTAIYILPEPDPFKNEKITDSRLIYFRFPNGSGPYDCETVFVWENGLYIVTKPWDGSLPRVYRGDDLEKGGELRFLAEVPVPAMITGGDVSRDGGRIVLSSYRALIVYEGQGTPEEILKTTPIVCQLNARQVEAAAWDGESIILTNEQREIFHISGSKWRNHRAPFLKRPEESVPFVRQRTSVHLPLDKWPKGQWLRIRLNDDSERFGRVLWSPEGLHIGLRLPEDVHLRTVDLNLAEDFDEWFLPGALYLLINPDGDRPLSYGENDRCLVFTRNGGKPSARALYLRPATLIRSDEAQPDWVRIQEDGQRLLITLTPETPGFGQLKDGREIGFNMIVIRGNGQMVSWAPLTRPFAWDQPNVWGLLELED